MRNVPRTNSRINPCNTVYFLRQTPCFSKHFAKRFISLYIVPYHHRATIRQQGNNFCPSATAAPETLPLYHITVQSERIWVDSAQILFLFSL